MGCDNYVDLKKLRVPSLQGDICKKLRVPSCESLLHWKHVQGHRCAVHNHRSYLHVLLEQRKIAMPLCR